jgi:hypothetical protein
MNHPKVLSSLRFNNLAKRSRTRTTAPLLVIISLVSVNVFGANEALAANEAAYALEIEPHFTFGAGNVYGRTGFGGGLRLGAPLAAGHLGNLSDNIAITFGADIVHYENCYYSSNCGANYLIAPVAAQLNLFVARSVSLFAEGGLFLYKGWLTPCGFGNVGCDAPSTFGVLPTLALGVRVHFTRNTAFTVRLGYPTITLGLSFM